MGAKKVRRPQASKRSRQYETVRGVQPQRPKQKQVEAQTQWEYR